MLDCKKTRVACALSVLALAQCRPQSGTPNSSEHVAQNAKESVSAPTATGPLSEKTGASATEVLAQQLATKGGDTAALALGKLVAVGKPAVPALVSALDSTDDQVRALAAEGLSQVADPGTADRLFLALGDPNPRVRAHAARTLAVVKDPRALDALILTVDDAEDVLHYPYTLSLYTLVRMPPTILPKVLPLLKAKGQVTRVRAFLVLKTIVSTWKPKEWNKIWEDLGRYDPAASEASRNASVGSWQAWIQQNVK
jgi:HEAT repeats